MKHPDLMVKSYNRGSNKIETLNLIYAYPDYNFDPKRNKLINYLEKNGYIEPYKKEFYYYSSPHLVGGKPIKSDCYKYKLTKKGMQVIIDATS